MTDTGEPAYETPSSAEEKELAALRQLSCRLFTTLRLDHLIGRESGMPSGDELHPFIPYEDFAVYRKREVVGFYTGLLATKPRADDPDFQARQQNFEANVEKARRNVLLAYVKPEDWPDDAGIDHAALPHDDQGRPVNTAHYGG